MRQPSFFSNPNLRRLGISAAAVTVMTLILSQGNFIVAIGAGIGTAVSVYVTNYRLVTKTKFLEEKIKDLINGLGTHSNSSELERIEKNSASSKEHSTSLQQDIESLKRKLAE